MGPATTLRDTTWLSLEEVSHRLNAVLSRARRGLYLVGNIGTFASSEVWSAAINWFKAQGRTGRDQDLCPSLHSVRLV